MSSRWPWSRARGAREARHALGEREQVAHQGAARRCVRRWPGSRPRACAGSRSRSGGQVRSPRARRWRTAQQRRPPPGARPTPPSQAARLAQVFDQVERRQAGREHGEPAGAEPEHRRPTARRRGAGSGAPGTARPAGTTAPEPARDDGRVVEPETRPVCECLFAHGRRSPIRNCSARSRRIWGSAGGAVTPALQRRRAEPQEAEIGSPRGAARQTTETAMPGRNRVGVGRQVAGEHRGLGLAVELRPPAVSPGWPARRRSTAASRRRGAPGLAGGAHRRRARSRRPARRPRPPARWRARPCARRIASSRSWLDVMQVVGLGGREQDAVDARPQQRASRRSAGPISEAVEDRLASAPSRSRTASGPALRAASASTSTIWRSRRAKWSRKNGRTTTSL